MPRAKPFPETEEEEKTTIESQWEDEASTTVEQGEIADRLRSLGAEPRTNAGTNTGAAPIDEPTVDDQQAHMSAITPLRDVARMQITAGNDAGNEIEIRPGKTYTIGRAIDNDIVLTDIAVSRKHFDLRFEDGAWVIVDRGSGNGTVVNGNLEDNPFMLANGDSIEIGNTVFRFDQPNAASRPQRTIDLDHDDEELSTVAGKPLRGDIADVLDQVPSPPAMRPQRPKTLPPPTPLRSAAASQPPPLGYPPPGPGSALLPSTTLPMAQMANRPPIGGPLPSLPGVSPPGAPTMLGDQLAIPMHGHPHGHLPTTIPGQGVSPQRQMYPYPQATEIPPHSVHAQMLLIQTQNRRGDGSTAHVPPAPFDMSMPPVRYSQPQLTKKAKLVLAGIGLAVFAAVMTVAIVKSGSAKTTTAKGDTNDPKVASKTTVEPIKPDQPKPKAIVTAPAPAPTKSATVTAPAPTTQQTAMTPTPTPTAQKTATPAPTAATTQKTAAMTPPTASTQPKTATPTAPLPTPTPTKTIATAAPAKTEPVKAKVDPKAAEKAAEKAAAKRAERERDRERELEKERERKERRAEERRIAEARRAAEPPAPAETPKPRPGANPDSARAEAERLYKAKKFNDAASYLSNQAKKFDEDVARELRKTADFYSKLGKALATGTAPATRPTVAYEALRSAATYDRNLSNEFDGEIQTKLTQVAPKAALSYIAQKNYAAARSTMMFLRQFPSAAETITLVKTKLESAAGEIYAEATGEMSSNPSGAKEKFKFIMTIVDPSSPWYKKATQKLSGG